MFKKGNKRTAGVNKHNFPEALTGAFEHCSSAASLRSKAYKNKAMTTGGTRHWQALFIPKEGWTIVEAINRGDYTKYNMLVEGLSFFDTIDFLARREESQNEQYLSEVATPVENLEYFRDVAEREGIIFDKMGLPHPTLYGEIVTEGNFSNEAIMQARAFYSEKTKAGQKVVKTIQEQKAAQEKKQRTSMKKVFVQAAEADSMRVLMNGFESIHALLSLAIDKPKIFEQNALSNFYAWYVHKQITKADAKYKAALALFVNIDRETAVLDVMADTINRIEEALERAQNSLTEDNKNQIKWHLIQYKILFSIIDIAFAWTAFKKGYRPLQWFSSFIINKRQNLKSCMAELPTTEIQDWHKLATQDKPQLLKQMPRNLEGFMYGLRLMGENIGKKVEQNTNHTFQQIQLKPHQ